MLFLNRSAPVMRLVDSEPFGGIGLGAAARSETVRRQAVRLQTARTRVAPGTHRSIEPPLSGHLPALDGLRGWAILAVLIHHFTPAAVGGSPFTRALLSLAHTGWTGVDLFFVLSGFLITGILLKTREKPGFFVNFYARRTLRIFPLYYGALVVLLILVPLLARGYYTGGFLQSHFKPLLAALPGMMPGQGWLWLYGTNFKIALEEERWQYVNHFWSLAVEEHFYLLWPLVVFYLSRKSLVGVCGLCLFSAPLLRFASLALGYDPVVAYVLTPCRVDALALGGLVAVLISRPGGVAATLPKLRIAGLVALGLLAAIVVSYGRLDRRDWVTSSVGFSLLSIVAAWVILSSAGVKSKRSVRGVLLLNPVARSLGKYSYGLYVLHVFLIPLYSQLFPWGRLTALTGSYAWALVLHAVLAIVCSWVVAVASYHGFEKHFLRLKSFFDYQKPVVREEPAYESLRLPTPMPLPLRKAA